MFLFCVKSYRPTHYFCAGSISQFLGEDSQLFAGLNKEHEEGEDTNLP